MKTLAFIFMALGCIACAFAVANMFFFFTMNDKIWMLSMMGGISLFFLGGIFEAYSQVPKNRWDEEKIKEQKRTAYTGLTLSLMCLPFIIIYVNP